MAPDAMSVGEIWRALLYPRRLLPILALGVPLVVVQGELTASAWGWPIMIAIIAGLVMWAPVAYQRLLGLGRSRATLPLRLAVRGGAHGWRDRPRRPYIGPCEPPAEIRCGR